MGTDIRISFCVSLGHRLCPTLRDPLFPEFPLQKPSAVPRNSFPVLLSKFRTQYNQAVVTDSTLERVFVARRGTSSRSITSILESLL